MPVANTGKPTQRVRPVPPVSETVGNPDYVAPKPIREGSQQTKTESPRGYYEGKYVEDVQDAYTFIAFAIMPFAPKTSMSIVEEDEDGKSVARTCAEGWDKLAKTSPRVRKFLEGTAGAGTVMGLAAAHIPILGSAAAELGLFNQIGKLFGRKKTQPEPEMNPENLYNPEFGRTAV